MAVIFIGGVIIFIKEAIISIEGAIMSIEEAVISIEGVIIFIGRAIIFIGKRSLFIGEGLFKIARVKVVDNIKGFNKYNLKWRLIIYKLKYPLLLIYSLISIFNYFIRLSL